MISVSLGSTPHSGSLFDVRFRPFIDLKGVSLWKLRTSWPWPDSRDRCRQTACAQPEGEMNPWQIGLCNDYLQGISLKELFHVKNTGTVRYEKNVPSGAGDD